MTYDFISTLTLKGAKMKTTYDWLDERNKIEELIDDIQDMCLYGVSSSKELKQRILEQTDKILISLDNIDYAIDDIESDYEFKIDELNEQIEELKGGK